MQDVFVSYRHAHKADVVAFCERLKAANLTFFRDEERRDDDDSIQRTIEAGLAEAKVFLAWYDPTYLQSKACAWEFSRALVAAYAGGDGLKRIVCIDPTGAFDHIVPAALKHEARLVRDGSDGVVGVLRARVDAFARRFGTSVVRGSISWYGLQRPSHPTWIGRAALLIELFDLSNMGGRMMDGGQRAPVALTGWGGEGKTMLAQQYALRFATAYPAGIVWISGATADGVTPREGEWLQQLETSLTGVAVALDIAIQGLVEGIPNARQRIVRIRAAIEHGLRAASDEAAATIAPYLWIVDDLPRDLGADDQRLWLAADARAHGVVTIRERRDVDAVCHVLPVRHLGEDEAIAILSRRRAPADASERAAAKAIVEALGRLPLALEAAGAYVAQRGHARYLKLLDAGSTEEVDRLVTSFTGALPTGHEASIVKTLLRSLDLLPGWDDARTDAPANAAWATLRIAALLAPLPLSEDFANRALQSGGWPLRNGLLWEEVRLLLYRAGLVQEADPSSPTAIDLHALVVRLVVDVRSTPERRQEAVEGIVAALDRWLEEKEGVDLSRVGSDLFDVALAIVPSCASEAAATVLLRIATLAWRAGRLSVARPLGERALLIRSAQFGDEHPDTLTSMNNLASTKWSQGDLDGVRTMQEQVLTVRRRVLGDEHPDTLVSMNNLASTMHSQGDLDGARTMKEQVLTVSRRVLGDEHPSTLTSMNNLTSTMQSQGDLDGARTMREQVLTVRRRVLGDEHPSTLVSMNNLASTMHSQGDLDGARTMKEQVLTVSRRVLGDEHPHTLVSMSNLAFTKHSQGDLDGARMIEEQVLTVRRRVLGDEHPDTLVSMSNLAYTICSQGDLDGARMIEEQVLTVRRRVLGDEHPDTLTARENLAWLAELRESAASASIPLDRVKS